MPRLYCSVYCDRSCGCNYPKSVMGRKFAQGTGVPWGGSRMLPKGFGRIPTPIPPVATVPQGTPQLCRTNGVLKNPSEMVVLPPNGGSAWNCSSTNCSIGL